MNIRIPISIKLVLSIVIVLLSSLSLLSYIAINIQVDDKKNSTYENQLNQAKIASEMMTAKIEASSSLLKQIAAKYKLGVSTNKEDVNYIYQNQSNLENIFVYELILETFSGEIETPILFSSERDSRENELKITEYLQETQLNPESLNISSFGEDKIMISLVDKTYDKEEIKHLVVLGVVNIEELSSSFNNHNMIFLNQKNEYFHEINNDFLEEVFRDQIKNIKENKSIIFSQNKEKYLATFTQGKFNIKTGVIKSWKYIMAPVYELVEKIIILTLLILFLGIPLAIFFSKKFSNPIEDLCKATDEVGRGNFKIKTAIKSGDEFGKLSHYFDKMAEKMGKLIKEQEEKVRLEKETQTAALVQQTLIPPEKIIGENYQIQSYYKPASECGGDWWGVIEKKNKLYLMIGDATGHGTASALMTSAAQSFCSIISDLLDTQELEPNKILNLANNSIYSSSKGKIMMTFFVAVIDFEKGTIKYSNAGHNAPLLVSQDSSKVSPLMASGRRLGESLNEKSFESAEKPFSPGDKLVLYTDGLIENTNLDKNEFGKKKFRKLLKKGKTGAEILKSVVDDFSLFLEGKKFTDDDTTLVIADLIPLKEEKKDAA